MKAKTFISMISSVMTAAALAAADAEAEAQRNAENVGEAEENVEVQLTEEKEADDLFNFGFDNELYTAYVWRNALVSDRAVWQPCVWIDMNLRDDLVGEFYVFQNWDLTRRNRDSGFHRAMNETDFDLHLTYTVWQDAEDEDHKLTIDVGHLWTTYRTAYSGYEEYPSAHEFYAGVNYLNPILNVHGLYCQSYHPITACYFEFRVDRDWKLTDQLSAGFDWNVNFANGKYQSEYLYEYDPVYDEYDEAIGRRAVRSGIAGTTLKGILTWKFNKNVSLSAVLAYTSVLNGDARKTMREQDWCHTFYNGTVWGGFKLALEF